MGLYSEKMKAFVPVCLYSNGYFLVKENVRRFLSEQSSYDEMLFVVVDALYGINLLIKDMVKTREEAVAACEKRGYDIFHLLQKCIRTHVMSSKSNTSYLIKRWNEIAESEEYIDFREHVIVECRKSAIMSDYCKRFINSNLWRMTKHLTHAKELQEADYLFSELAMSLYLTEFRGYTNEIWERPQDISLPDPITVLYEKDLPTLKTLIGKAESERRQLYINLHSNDL